MKELLSRPWPKHRGKGELIPLKVERNRGNLLIVIALLMLVLMLVLFLGIGRAEARCLDATLCFGGFKSVQEATDFVGLLDNFEQQNMQVIPTMACQTAIWCSSTGYDVRVVFQTAPIGGGLCASRVFTTPTVPVACDPQIHVMSVPHGPQIMVDGDGNWFVEAPLR